ALAISFQRVESACVRSFAGNPTTVAIDGLPSSTVRRSNPDRRLIHTPVCHLLLVGPRDFIGLLSCRPRRVRGLTTLSAPFMVCSQFLLRPGRLDLKATRHIAQDLGLAAIGESQISGVS